MIWRALCLSTLLSDWIFLNTRSIISISQLLLPALSPSPQFTHWASFGHWFVLSLVWSSSPQVRQTAFRRHLVFVCPYLWQLWHIMGLSWYLHTAVFDGYPGIYILYGCSCRLNVRSTTVVLDFLDLMKVASTAFSMNDYALCIYLFFQILHWIRSSVCR